MSKFFSAILIFAYISVYANNFGRSIPPIVDSTGKASFGITYAYDTERNWSLLFTSNLSSTEISKLPEVLFWTIVDIKIDSIYQDWSQMSKNNLVGGSFEVSNITSLFKFLPKMKQSVIMISTDKKSPLYYIDLKNLCETYPNNINDLSNSMNQKCIVNSSQIPDLTAECKEETEQLQDWIKKGLITCEIANNQLVKKGCETLNCH
jgi:hypothetical protein